MGRDKKKKGMRSGQGEEEEEEAMMTFRAYFGPIPGVPALIGWVVLSQRYGQVMSCVSGLPATTETTTTKQQQYQQQQQADSVRITIKTSLSLDSLASPVHATQFKLTPSPLVSSGIHKFTFLLPRVFC